MKDLEKGKAYYISSNTEDYQLEKLYKWLLINDKDWDLSEERKFKYHFVDNYLTYDGEEWSFTEETELEMVPVESLLKKSGWYYDKRSANWLMYHDFEANKYYGFREGGGWFENTVKEITLSQKSELAPIEEVTSRLTIEAIKRGFKGRFNYDHVYNEFWCDGTTILSSGVWEKPTHKNLTPLLETVEIPVEVGKNCYYFYHSEKHGPNFYTKEEVPFHDGKDWKEDLVVYTQLGSGKKFVTTKERFKKFKEVWI